MERGEAASVARAGAETWSGSGAGLRRLIGVGLELNDESALSLQTRAELEPRLGPGRLREGLG